MIRFRLWAWLWLPLMSPTLLVASNNADVLDRGQTLVGARYIGYQTDYFWNRNGNKVKSYNNFKRYQGDLCVAFGVTDYDTIHVQGTYARIQETANGNINGFDDAQISWKHYLGKKWGFFWTGRLEAVVPVGVRKLSLRYGRWAGEADLFMKKELCFRGRPLWYNFGAGYRLYQGYPSDQARGYFEAGYTLFNRFSILVDSQLYYGVFNGSRTDAPNQILYNANYRLLNGRVYGVFQVHTNAYLFLGGFRHLWGQNIGTGGGIFAGSYVTF